MNTLSKSQSFTIAIAPQPSSCIDVQLKEFASTHSYHCSYIPTDCRFHLTPNNRFPQPRNAFRPEIDCHLIQPSTLSIALSLCPAVRTVIVLLYLAMFLFLGTMAVKQVSITGIAIWFVLFLSTSIFLLLGKMVSFRLTISNLKHFFEI